MTPSTKDAGYYVSKPSRGKSTFPAARPSATRLCHSGWVGQAPRLSRSGAPPERSAQSTLHAILRKVQRAFAFWIIIVAGLLNARAADIPAWKLVWSDE